MASGSSSTQRSSTKPWKHQAPYLQDIMQQAQQLYNQPQREFYPGQTVADYDPASLQAFDRAQQRATYGSPVARAAEDESVRTLRGDYLSPGSNPYLDQTFDAGARRVQRAFKSSVGDLRGRFEAAGRSGSGSAMNAENRAQDTLATNLSEMAAQVYGGNYQQERGRQQYAMQTAPGVNEMGYRDINALRAVGEDREGRSQAVIDDLMARFNFAQYEPTQRLQEYSAFIGNPVLTQRSSGTARAGGVLS